MARQSPAADGGADARRCAPPPEVPRAPRNPLPQGAWDTHCHVFGPADRYPLCPLRNYTPAVASPGQYRGLMRALGIEHAVLVQPSVYGTDHRAMLDALREAMPPHWGVAVPPPGIDEAGLDALHEAGVRALRLNLVNPAVISLDEAVALAARTAERGWHLQVQLDLANQGSEALQALTKRIVAPIVLDHFGLADPIRPSSDLLELVERGRCWVKLSAPYRLRSIRGGAANPELLVRLLVAANPTRLLWGSDWPHTELARPPHAADWAELLMDLLPDEATRRQVFADNAERLFSVVSSRAVES